MRTIRYVFGLLLLVGLPPGVLLWFAIHPLASFWRRLGLGWTYGLLAVPTVALMVVLFLARRPLMGPDLGTHYVLLIPAAILLTASGVIAVKRKKYLPLGVLVGIPELSATRYPGKLVDQGIYGRVRHPRYVEALLGTLGCALIANYLGVYVLFLVAIPAIYVVVLIEERELRDRFGAAYEEYCRRVPRFVPRTRGGSGPQGG